jgi:hypothetical protein
VPPMPGSKQSYRAELGAFEKLPRARMGALPFPGPLTLHTRADPDDLGRHCYNESNDNGDNSEHSRGILYTRRAGFLDMSHVRNAADMTAYLHARTKLAITNDWEAMQFRSFERSHYLVRFRYPDGWELLDHERRSAAAHELALRVAQHLAHDVMNWHEIITWYGYKSTIIFPERGSAFTYEDTTSHALGIELAAEALRNDSCFDSRITALLSQAMIDLEAVDKEEFEQAIDRVKGEWWSTPGIVKRRMLDIGHDDGIIEPWIVPGMEHEHPIVFRLPDLSDVDGLDCSEFFKLSIDPNILEGFIIRSRLEGSPEHIDPDIHFPVLLADIADDVNTSPDPD